MPNPLLIPILSGLAGAGLYGLLTRENKDGSIDLFKDDKLVTNIPPYPVSPPYQIVLDLPIADLKVTFRRIEAPTSKGEPQISITYVSEGARLYGLDLLADATFKLTGQIEIDLNNSTLFSNDIGDFTDADISLTIPKEGVSISKGVPLKLNAWDSGGGFVTVLIVTGYKPIPI